MVQPFIFQRPFRPPTKRMLSGLHRPTHRPVPIKFRPSASRLIYSNRKRISCSPRIPLGKRPIQKAITECWLLCRAHIWGLFTQNNWMPRLKRVIVYRAAKKSSSKRLPWSGLLVLPYRALRLLNSRNLVVASCCCRFLASAQDDFAK